jgi:hypothetical protein
MTTAAAVPVPAEQRRQLMDAATNEFVGNGWRVESRSEFQGVFVKGHRPNHVLHLILSIVTLGLWIPVWILVTIMSGEKRRIVSVDEYGQRRGQ